MTCLKKTYLLPLILILAIGLVSAADVALVVKTSSNSNIVSALSELGYSYDIVTESQIGSTDFSQYATILVQDDLTNEASLPLATKNSLFINKDAVGIAWGSSWQAYSTSGSFAQIKQLASPFTDGFSLGQFSAYTLSKTQYYAKRISSGGISIYGIAYPTGTSSQLYPAVAYSSNGNVRSVFFGLTEINSWTSQTKNLFKNSLMWVRLGVDFDEDGWYSDSDCNDNDAGKWQYLPGYVDGDLDGFGSGSLIQVCSGNSLPSGYSTVPGDCNDQNSMINPDATEIAYDGFDNDCKNGDLADVDGDGYCKKDYLISNRFVQCASESGNYGTDCNDGDSSFSPGSSDLAKNCRNDAPIFTGSIANITFNEDFVLENAVNLNNYFSDPDGDTLALSIYNKTSNLIVNIIGGIASVSSTKDWNGDGFIVFKAQDSSLFSLSNSVNVKVVAVNDAPVMEDISDIKIVEGQKAIINVDASDIDSASLTYSVNDSRFVQQTEKNVFEWQTSIGNSETYYVNVLVSDGELSDSKMVKIEVLPKLVINEFLSRPSTDGEWIEIYNPRSGSFDLTGCYIEDLARNHIQLSGMISGNGFFVKEMTNILNNDGDLIMLYCGGEMLDNVTYGSGNVAVPGIGESAGRVSDGVDTDSTSDWKVYNSPTRELSNSADVISPEVKLIYPENNSVMTVSSFSLNFTVSDNQASSLNCSLYSDVLDGNFKNLASQIVSNGSKKSFFVNDAENGNYKWQIKCLDSRNTGLSEIRNFKLNAPKAPIIQNIANVTVNETDIAKIIINATDSNPEDALTYSVVNAGKTNFTQDLIDNKLFTWNTEYTDAGIYNVIVSVSDSVFTINKTVKVTVLNKNRAPVMQDIENQTLNEDVNKTIVLSASDPDGEALVFRVKSQNVSSVKCQVSGTSLTLIPALNWNGESSCVIEASDGVLSDSKTVYIKVLAVNDAPVMKSIADVSVQESEQAKIVANASDIDSAVLTYSVNDSRFVQNNNVFTWNTVYGDDGVYYVNVSVNDGELMDSKIVKVTVLNKNEPPHITPLENLTINEDSGTSYLSLNAIDNDGTIDRFEVSYQDSRKVNCAVSDKSLAITPAKDFYGNSICKIKVYDNSNAYDETTLNIQVINVNDAPVIDSYSPGFSPIIAEDGKQDFFVVWHDIDNSSADIKVEWFVDGVSSGLGNAFVYTAQGKNAEIKVRVSDTESYTEQLWQLTTSTIPIANNYDGETTSFSGMNDSQLSSTSLVLEKTGKGKIEFLDNVDLRNVVDLDHYSDIQTGLAALDTNYFKSLAGKIARITLYNLGFDKLPTIYYNSAFTLNRPDISQTCGDMCRNVSYSNGTLTFYSGFSSFKIGSALSCSEQGGNVCSSGEICSGSWTSAVENSCCLGTCSPKFSDADRCENISSEIEVSIKDPDEGDEFKINEKIPLEVKVRNNAEDDLSFDVQVYLYDLTNDESVDDYSKSLDVDSGNSETLNLDMTIPSGIDESDDFAVFVKVDDGDYCNEKFVKVDIQRERNDLRISNFEIPDSVDCGDSIEATVSLENIGKEKENVELEIFNSELGISDTSSFNLEKYSEDKNSRKVNLVLNIPDFIEEKSYALEASAVFSGETETLKKDIFVRCEKKQQETSQETGVIKLNSQVVSQKASEKSFFDSFNDRINRMDMTELTMIVVDIFLVLGIIFIIIYLLFKK